jgi:hypothetical protein
MPEGSGSIIFRDPRPGVVLSPYYGNGVSNCNMAPIRPDAGTLLLFPNWLEHEVEAHGGTTPRMSIAMNAIAC